VSWKEIAAQTAPVLPKDISTRLDDEKSVRGRLEGPVLRLEVIPGFLYGRFNRQEVLAKFSETASRLAGYEVRAQLSELSDDPGSSKRSLDDLKAFKEVRFVLINYINGGISNGKRRISRGLPRQPGEHDEAGSEDAAGFSEDAGRAGEQGI
jgi:hypothetical protein